MQAIIMAAGKGSRLYPLTEDKPKCFIEINEKKLIDYQIELLNKKGIEEIIVVTGYKWDKIENHLKKYKNVTTVYNPFYDVSNVIVSFWVGMNYLKKDFIYMHADTIFDEIILDNLLAEKNDIVLPIDIKKCGEEEMKVRLSNEGKIIEISKLINPNEALGEFIGVTKISQAVLKYLKSIVESELKQRNLSSYFERVLQVLINEKMVSVSWIDISKYFWNEIDFIEDYEFVINNIHKSSL